MSMLRSRSRGEENIERWSAETMPNAWFTPNSLRKTVRHRVRPTKWRCIWLAILVFVFWGYMRHSEASGRRRDGPGNTDGTNNQTLNGDALDVRRHTLKNRTATGAKSPSATRRSAKWKYPLVDRAILEKLDRMEQFYMPDYYKIGSSPTATEHLARWPPKVTHVPERGSSRTAKGDATDAICESPKHPRACRFLLPLRINEQESKARIHSTQIAQLARALNRTLVLPNVGKSKVGACFKWEFGTYYNVASLGIAAGADTEAFVELDDFKEWLDGRDQQGAVKSQLISLGTGQPAHTRFREGPVHSNPDVSVLAYQSFGAWERDLPGCFDSKLDRLALETMPVFMSTAKAMNKDGSIRLIGDSVVEAFSSISSRAGQQDMPEIPLDLNVVNNGLATSPSTEVLVVNWDLRHRIFPSGSRNSLQYSKRMYDLAEKYAPKTPYLVVQWRMETINPERLENCAHALVDVLSRILHDSALAENITTVWLASDYPYPIAKRSLSQKRPAVIAKSGTFRDFDVQHEEAVEILRKEFVKEGELSNWELTDFAEAIEPVKGTESELLQDSGVLGILDKIVAMKANLFVSGASRCSRKSSFTKQVVEARSEEWSRSGEALLRNIVEIFG